MPPPMTQKTFLDLQDTHVALAYIKAAQDNMISAGNEVRQATGVDNNDEVVNIMISADGTWQRRGFSSLNGVVTIIANNIGKCIDYRVKTKNCNSCKYWEKKKGTKKYDDYHDRHNCQLNHVGSSGSMESDGIVDCLKNSI